MDGPKLVAYIDSAGDHRWRLVAANGEIVIPPEAHTSDADALRAAHRAAEILVAAITAGAIETKG